MVRHASRLPARERGSDPMLRDNEVLKKMIATGEERMSKLASQLLQNETFMGALQKTMSAALDVKATAERAAASFFCSSAIFLESPSNTFSSSSIFPSSFLTSSEVGMFIADR